MQQQSLRSRSATLLSVLSIVLASFFPIKGDAQAGQVPSVDCKTTGGAVATVTFDLSASSSPCEVTLRSNGVVVVTVIGANPALAEYTLKTSGLNETRAATQSNANAVEPPLPATPAIPNLSTERIARLTLPVFQAVDAGAVPDTSQDRYRAAQWRVATVFSAAHRFIDSAPARLTNLRTESVSPVCAQVHDNLGFPYDQNSFWSIAEGASLLVMQVNNAFDFVKPPVSENQLSLAKECVANLRSTPVWSSLISLGPSLATRAFTESRGKLADLVSDGTRIRDSLQVLAFPETVWRDPSVRQQVQDRRNELVSQLNMLTSAAQRSLDSDFSTQTLTNIIENFNFARRLADYVMASSNVVVVETTLSGTRGESRNVMLEWKPWAQVPEVTSGSRIILLDRFRGYLVRLSGGAGFAGTRVSELLRKSAFNAEGVLIADSVDLVTNRRVVWRPALSTGVSLTYSWRSGFYVGGGIEFAVLSSGEGTTTRIGFPVLHGGRDDMRVFVGTLLGRSDEFVFEGSQRIRLGRGDPDPENLILRQSRPAWERPEFYIGIVVGQRSLDPSTLTR